MTMLTLNRTERARDAATLIAEHCGERHRGAMRFPKGDTDKTFCVALFGNDGYTKRDDSDPDLHTRTKAYVHNLYVGVANLLSEGAVEFETDKHGSTWVILANFPRHEEHDDYHGEDSDPSDENDNPLVVFWDAIVWEQWKSQVVVPEN